MNKEIIKALFKLKLEAIDAFVECLPDNYGKFIRDSKNDFLDIIKNTIEENQKNVKNENVNNELKKISIS